MVIWVDIFWVIMNGLVSVVVCGGGEEVMINGDVGVVGEGGGEGVVVGSVEDVVSDDEVLEMVFIIGDDDAMAVLLHVKEVVDDVDVGFLMGSFGVCVVDAEAIAVGMDDIVLDGDIGEGSSLFGGKTYSLSVVIGDILLDGDIVAVSCLCVDIDTWSDESMVADDVVLDEPVSASIFHVDSFFVGVVYVVVGDGEGVCSAETEGFLVHVHTDGVDGVVMDGDVMGIAVSMVDDDAA
jgi:hypothetical protein